MSRADLAAAQAALVAALVADAPLPAGFDELLVAQASAALRHKRAGGVAATWPALRASFGARWPEAFMAWSVGKAPQGALRDGWDFARFSASHSARPSGGGAGDGSDGGGGGGGGGDGGGSGGGVGGEGRGDGGGGGLSESAEVELAQREACWHYDGVAAPRRRLLPTLRRTRTAVVLQIAGRVWTRTR